MRWLKRLLAGILALLVLVMTVVYLTPLDTYVPEMERTLGEQLHEPVSIRHLRIAALPLPHLELQEVRIGGQGGITARSVNVQPDLPALLVGTLAVRRILVQDGTANLALVRKLAGLFGSVPAAAQSVAVRELQLSRMNLRIPGMAFGPIEGRLEFAQAGGLERAWFAMDEQKITAELLPLPERRFSIKAQAHAWAPPQFPQILLDDMQVEGVLGKQDFVAQKFAVAWRGIRAAGSGKVEFSEGWRVQATVAQADAPLERVMALLEKPVELTGTISAKGTLDSKADTLGTLKDNFQFSGDVLIKHATARISAESRQPLVFDQIRARIVAQPEHLELGALEVRLYGGKLSGVASLNRKNAMLVADVTVNSVAMQSLVEALTSEVLFTGSMDGAAKFSMRLDAFERFPENLKLAGDFHLRNGELTKVDLAQAVNSPGKTANARGTTKFDDLTGLLSVDANGYHFRRLKIASGSLHAEGKLGISPSLRLGGTLDTRIKGTAGLVSMPMVVSGTLNDPVVRPSGSALVGAAVGTALLGPGFGTAIGVKIGGFLNKLLGKKDNDKNSGKDTVPHPPAKNDLQPG